MSGYNGTDETKAEKETFILTANLTKTNTESDRITYPYQDGWLLANSDTSGWEEGFHRSQSENHAANKPYFALDGRPNLML